MKCEGTQSFTEEQKLKFEPMLHKTWQAIGYDCLQAFGKLTQRDIIEIVCDATYPVTYGGMSKDEYKALSDAYGHRDTQKWLRKVLNY